MKQMRRLSHPWNRTTAPISFILAAIFIGAVPAALPARQQQPTQTTYRIGPDRSAYYLRWLNEDVVYLITNEERAAFQRLTTDEERQKFIEQFWQRRDGTPGTARNEFKEEHYRRIAYVNERFASSKPGWKTDRGRIYIKYGPPDEIKTVPPKPGQFGSERWFYRHIEGVGDLIEVLFVDKTGSGDYEITVDPITDRL